MRSRQCARRWVVATFDYMAATITGTVVTSTGSGIGVHVVFQLILSHILTESGALVVPSKVTTTTDVHGAFTTTLIAGTYVVSVSCLPFTFTIIVSATSGSFDWMSLVVTLTPPRNPPTTDDFSCSFVGTDVVTDVTENPPTGFAKFESQVRLVNQPTWAVSVADVPGSITLAPFPSYTSGKTYEVQIRWADSAVAVFSAWSSSRYLIAP